MSESDEELKTTGKVSDSLNLYFDLECELYEIVGDPAAFERSGVASSLFEYLDYFDFSDIFKLN